MAQLTSPLPELTQAAGKTDDLVGQLTGAVAAAVAALQRAAGLNMGFASAAVMLQFGVQTVEAIRKLSAEGRDQAGLYRTTVADMSAAEAKRVQALTEAGATIPGAGTTRAV